MKIRFFNNGVTRNVKVGFSWTVLFFGPLAFAMRGMWAMFAVSWIVAIFTLGLSSFVFPFFANKWYARHLAENGWIMLDAAPKSWGIEKGAEAPGV